MKKRTLTALIALLIVCAMALTACGGGSGNSSSAPAAETTAEPASTAAEATEAVGVPEAAANTAKSDETLTVMLNAEPDTLLAGTMNEGACIVQNTFAESILRYDAATKGWLPGICTGYETVDDTHYTFTLREGVAFSDGTPVTVDDILFSLKWFQEAGNANAQYIKLDETAKIDDSHFTLALTQYVPGWETFINGTGMIVMSEAGLEAAGGADSAARKPPVTVGRYIFKEWEPGSYITVERNENYYDPDYTAYYKTIRFVFVADSASRVLSLQSGDADVALRLSTADMIPVDADPNLQSLIVNTGIYMVYFNNSKGPCADAKVREALTYAIDGAAVNAAVMMNKGEVVRSFSLPEFVYYKDFEVIKPDYEKAKALLAEAGYPDGLELYLPVIKNNSNVATVVQECLRQAGVTVTVENVEQQSFLEKTRSSAFDLIVGSKTLTALATNSLNQVNPKASGRNPQNCWPNAEQSEVLNEMIKRSNSSDEATRAQAWDELQTYMFDQYMLVPTCTNHLYAAMKAGLEGYSTCNIMDYADVTEIHPAA